MTVIILSYLYLNTSFILALFLLLFSFFMDVCKHILCTNMNKLNLNLNLFGGEKLMFYVKENDCLTSNDVMCA